jgi:hypothetical protein
MKNLSHSASFQPKDKIAPSNAGTKQFTSWTQAHAVEAHSVDDAELEFQLQTTILADSGFGSDWAT